MSVPPPPARPHAAAPAEPGAAAAEPGAAAAEPGAAAGSAPAGRAPPGPSADPPAPSATAVRRIAQNAGALLLAYLVPRILTFGAVVVAARVLGAAEFGAYGTAAALAVILSIVATLGMMPLLVRDLARAPERAPELLRAAHRVKTIANLVMLAALLVLARWVLDYPPIIVTAALLLGVGYAVGAYVENLAAYFQAVERMHVWMQASAALGIVGGGAGVLLLVTTRSLAWFCAASIAGQLAALGWLLYRAPPAVRRGGPVEAGAARRLLARVAPFAAAFVALTVYYKLDVLLLARWRPAVEVGVYAAAYKFIDIVHALAVVGAGAIYPRLSRATAPAGGAGEAGAAAGAVRPSGAAPRAAGRAATRVVELALLAGVPLGALVALLRVPLVEIVFGAAYAPAAPVLGLLAAAVPALALNILAGYVLGAAGRMLPLAGAYAGAVAVNAGLNALLIPRHGPVGAAAAMLASELLLALVLLAVVRVWAAARPGRRAVGVALAAAALAGVAAAAPVGVYAAAALYLAGVLLLYHRAAVLPAGERAALRAAVYATGGMR